MRVFKLYPFSLADDVKYVSREALDVVVIISPSCISTHTHTWITSELFKQLADLWLGRSLVFIQSMRSKMDKFLLELNKKMFMKYLEKYNRKRENEIINPELQYQILELNTNAISWLIFVPCLFKVTCQISPSSHTIGSLTITKSRYSGTMDTQSEVYNLF